MRWPSNFGVSCDTEVVAACRVPLPHDPLTATAGISANGQPTTGLTVLVGPAPMHHLSCGPHRAHSWPDDSAADPDRERRRACGGAEWGRCSTKRAVDPPGSSRRAARSATRGARRGWWNAGCARRTTGPERPTATGRDPRTALSRRGRRYAGDHPERLAQDEPRGRLGSVWWGTAEQAHTTLAQTLLEQHARPAGVEAAGRDDVFPPVGLGHGRDGPGLASGAPGDRCETDRVPPAGPSQVCRGVAGGRGQHQRYPEALGEFDPELRALVVPAAEHHHDVPIDGYVVTGEHECGQRHHRGHPRQHRACR